MFTGIIEQLTNITGVRPHSSGALRLSMTHPSNFEVQHGDSVSVDGCCLTVAAMEQNQLHFDLSRETLDVTNLRNLKVGDSVNVERALAFGGRLGGHLVLGHVDTVGKISVIDPQLSGWIFGVRFAREHGPLIIPKGSIAIQGISLTINEIEDLDTECEVRVMLIPTTLQKTTLARAVVGQSVNLEFDLIGKYILRKQALEVQ